MHHSTDVEDSEVTLCVLGHNRCLHRGIPKKPRRTSGPKPASVFSSANWKGTALAASDVNKAVCNVKESKHHSRPHSCLAMLWPGYPWHDEGTKTWCNMMSSVYQAHALLPHKCMPIHTFCCQPCQYWLRIMLVPYYCIRAVSRDTITSSRSQVMSSAPARLPKNEWNNDLAIWPTFARPSQYAAVKNATLVE